MPLCINMKLFSKWKLMLLNDTNICIFWQTKEHNSRMEQVVKSKVDLGLPFMVPDLVYKFQMICLRET
jgi:hypothetical protein